MNSLPKTVTRQSRGCDFNLGPSAPESNTLTTRLPSYLSAVGSIHEILVAVYATVVVATCFILFCVRGRNKTGSFADGLTDDERRPKRGRRCAEEQGSPASEDKADPSGRHGVRRPGSDDQWGRRGTPAAARPL